MHDINNAQKLTACNSMIIWPLSTFESLCLQFRTGKIQILFSELIDYKLTVSKLRGLYKNLHSTVFLICMPKNAFSVLSCIKWQYSNYTLTHTATHFALTYLNYISKSN